jgi:hypothetical protein
MIMWSFPHDNKKRVSLGVNWGIIDREDNRYLKSILSILKCGSFHSILKCGSFRQSTVTFLKKVSHFIINQPMVLGVTPS